MNNTVLFTTLLFFCTAILGQSQQQRFKSDIDTVLMRGECEIAFDQYEIYKKYYDEDIIIETKIKNCFKDIIYDYFKTNDCDNAEKQYEIYKLKYGEDKMIRDDINACIRQDEPPPRSTARNSRPVDPTPLSIRGRITDTDGKNLSGAKITVQGSGTFFPSNNQGRFEIPIYNGTYKIIEISLDGYEPKQLKISEDDNNIVVELRKKTIETPSNSPKLILGIGNGIVAGKGMGVYGTIRFGETFSTHNTPGFGITGGFGLMGSKNDIYRLPWSNDIHEKLYHWSIGITGLYNIKDKSSLFVSGHYGTASVLDSQLSNNKSGTFTLQNDKILNGVSVLGGVESTFGNQRRDWFHLTAGIGGTYTIEDSPTFMFAWNVGIGIILNGRVKKH